MHNYGWTQTHLSSVKASSGKVSPLTLHLQMKFLHFIQTLKCHGVIKEVAEWLKAAEAWGT